MHLRKDASTTACKEGIIYQQNEILLSKRLAYKIAAKIRRLVKNVCAYVHLFDKILKEVSSEGALVGPHNSVSFSRQHNDRVSAIKMLIRQNFVASLLVRLFALSADKRLDLESMPSEM